MVNTDKQFLAAIHGTIIRKKRQWTTMFTSAMMLLVVFITYESSNIIQFERYESLWSEYQYEQEEYYSGVLNRTNIIQARVISLRESEDSAFSEPLQPKPAL